MTAQLESKVLAGLMQLIAHDLRSPLTALQSNLDFASRELDKPGPYAQEAILDGLLSCDAFAHVIENCDLLTLVLSEQEPLPAGPVPVTALLAQVMARCSSVATSYTQTLQLDVEDEVGALEVKSDGEMLNRALCNLVRNAAQHSPPNATLRISAQQAGDLVEILVQDQGLAMPAALRDIAFTAVGQLSEALHRSRYSRGIGLYCAQIAASLCGAQIKIIERPEASNTFLLQVAKWS